MKKFKVEMSLQFTVEDLINPFVSLSYLSFEEKMEVGDPPSVIEGERYDSDIEVIACYMEEPTSRSLAVAELCTTNGISGSVVDLSLLEWLYGPSTKEYSEPLSDLVEFVLWNYPPLDSPRPVNQQHIARCSQLEPLPGTPQSPPAHERSPNFSHWTDPWEEEQFQYQPENPHIRGVAVSTS